MCESWAESPSAPGGALRTALVLIASIAIAVACSAPSGGFAELDAMEEADLAFPDSSLLVDGGYDAELTVEGRRPAATWAIYGTSANAADVTAYFEEEMEARGWDALPGIPSTSEVDALSWRRGNHAFRIGILDVEEWHQRVDGSEGFPTMYEVRVSERRNAER